MISGVIIVQKDDLKQGIKDAIETVTPDVLSRVCQELEYRVGVFKATNGAYIELHLRFFFYLKNVSIRKFINATLGK